MAFKVGDKVRVVEGSGCHLTAGEEHTVSFVDTQGWVGLDGAKKRQWMPRRFELVEAPAFKQGDKVRVVNYKPSPNQNGIEGTIKEMPSWRGLTSLLITVTKPSGKSGGGYSGMELCYLTSEVELIKEEVKPVNTTGAMGREQALAQRKRLIDSGLFKESEVSLSTRSWDAEARFFAVSAGGRRFQSIKQVDEFLASQQPIDVEPYYINGDQFMFRTAEGFTIPTQERGGLTWWTEDMIRATGGVAVYNGRRYRFVRKVTEIKPFVDNSK